MRAEMLPIRRHFATLDGLRGVAALVVVTLHALDSFDLSSLTPHAGLAVDFFFCLSGFVIGYAYEQRLLNTMSFLEFATARVIRLYPLILVGTLLGFAVFVAKSVTSHQSPLTPNSLIALACEFLMVPSPIPIGQGWTGITPFDPPAWSLFFEFLANFIYAAFVRRLSKSVLAALLIFGAIIVLAQSYSIGGVGGGDHWNDLFGGVSRVFFPFFCGVFLFRRWTSHPSVERAKLAPVIAILLLGVLLYPVPRAANWLYESLAVLVAFPVIISAGARDTPGTLATSFYLFLGRLSYPLYILHYPLIRVFSNYARAHALHGFQFWLLFVVEIVCAIGFSIVMMKFFDEPFRSWLSWKWRSWRQMGATEETA
jgi:peptidoglycan/LPS O-acetylase OafA/YrhL